MQSSVPLGPGKFHVVVLVYEIKTKGYGVIGVNVFLRKLMRFLLLLTGNYPVLVA